jgi:hypothetical protein
VTKRNVTDVSVGTILTPGYQDGDDVRAKIVIHDTDTVKQTGMRELSLGYNLVLDLTPGEWKGQKYDAIQTEIAINHLALVPEARAGEQARLNIDNKQKNLQKGANKMSKTKKAMNADEMKKVLSAFDARRKMRLDAAAAAKDGGGNSDSGSETAEGIKENSDNPDTSIADRLKCITDKRDRRDEDGDSDELEYAKVIIAEQDEDISQLVEMIEELQAVIDLTGDSNSDKSDNSDEDEEEENEDAEVGMNADSVDAIIAERLKLGRIGDKLKLDGLETLKPIDAKKMVVNAVRKLENKPEIRFDGKSNTYINTAFGIAVQDFESRKDTSYQRKQMFNGDSTNFDSLSKSNSQKARDNMLERIKNGGKD